MALHGIVRIATNFHPVRIVFHGAELCAATVAAIIIGGGPLFVAIMAHFMIANDKLSGRKVFSIILGLTGVVFISVSKGLTLTTTHLFWIGIFLLLISNITGALTNIIVAKNKNRVSPVMLTAFANFTGGILLYTVSCFTEDYALQPYDATFYGALVWLALIPAVAFSIWYTLLKRPETKVSELNIWKFVTPVSGAILSWILLPGETPDLYSVTGILIISSALILLQLKPSRRT